MNLRHHILDSYDEYTPADIKEVVRYTITDDPAAFYGCKSVAELLDSMNRYLNKYGIELVDAAYNSLSDDFGNSLSWSSPHIMYAGTQRDGVIVVAVAAEDLLEDVENDYIDDWTDFVRELTNVLVHEYTHRYQLSQYNDQRNNYLDSEYAYLTNKGEMAARAFAAVQEMLSIGYTKEQILKMLRGKDISWFNETVQLHSYFNLYLEEDSREIKQLKKYLYEAIEKID